MKDTNLKIILVLGFILLAVALSAHQQKILDTQRPVESLVSVFRNDIRQFPDSVIEECSLPQEKYFSVSLDSVNKEGEHIIGGVPTIYTIDGREKESCVFWASPDKQSSFCKSFYSNSACTVIFQSNKNRTGGPAVDLYNLK